MGGAQNDRHMKSVRDGMAGKGCAAEDDGRSRVGVRVSDDVADVNEESDAEGQRRHGRRPQSRMTSTWSEHSDARLVRMPIEEGSGCSQLSEERQAPIQGVGPRCVLVGA